MNPIQVLTIYAQLVTALHDGTPINDDAPSLWGRILLANPQRLVETDSKESFLQYILWSAATHYMTMAFSCEQKGDSKHVKLLSKAGRALVLASSIQETPEGDLCPSVAIDGTEKAIALFIELLRYKTRTKPPATLEEKQYNELLGILRIIVELAKSVTENKKAHKLAKNWGRAVLRYAQIEIARTQAHLIAKQLQADEHKLSCRETAQKMNVAVRLLIYANEKAPLLHDMQAKLAAGYINDLPTSEKPSSFEPAELAAVKKSDVSMLAIYPGVFDSSIAASIVQNSNLDTVLPKIFDSYVPIELE